LEKPFFDDFSAEKKMEYTCSLELQRYLRVGVIPLGNTQEDVVSSVQRQLARKE